MRDLLQKKRIMVIGGAEDDNAAAQAAVAAAQAAEDAQAQVTAANAAAEAAKQTKDEAAILEATRAQAAAAAAVALSDESAKLLKEVMKKKTQNAELKTELDVMRAALSKFDNINMEEVSALLKGKKDAADLELEQKGQWDTLKAQMKSQNDEITSGLNTQIQTLTDAVAQKDRLIGDLTIGHSFDTSVFMDEINLSPRKARIIYGDHFEIESGVVVSYDRPRGESGRVQLVNADGDNLKFDVAIAKIVDSDPDKASIMRSKALPGAGSGTEGGNVAGRAAKLTGVAKINAALSSEG